MNATAATRSVASEVAFGYSAVGKPSTTLTHIEICGSVRPIDRIDTRINKPRKRRIRPIPYARDVPMLNRIEMHITHMPSVIQIVANRVFANAAARYPVHLSQDARQITVLFLESISQTRF